MKILAVIQARGGSKGIPKKNIYPINGYPLIAYTIAAARKSKLISELVVSTDAEDIADVAKAYGAKVPFMRPDHLAGDKVLSVDSLHHAVLETEKLFNQRFDIIVELPCVSPLRDHEDIDAALNTLIKEECDSVISMACTGEKHPVRLKKLINQEINDFTQEYPEPGQNSRRQDLDPPAYIRNGAIYAMKRDVLIEQRSRHGQKSLAHVMSEAKSSNIDEMEDLKIVEFKIKNGDCNNNPWEYLEKLPEVSQLEDKPFILVTTSLDFRPDIKEKLKQNYSCIFLPLATKEEVMRLFLKYKIEGWICGPTPKYLIDKEIISTAKYLKIIVTPSTGSNHINKADCKDYAIKVTSLRGTDFVNEIYASSEFAFTMILSVARNLPKAYLGVLGYKWRESEDLYRSIEFRGKTLGLIGFGRIGSNVAKYASAMGMNIIAYDPFVEIPPIYETANSHIELLSNSDIILLAVHLDESTKNLVNSTWFNEMKEGCIFVNISRGEIIDETALIEALMSGKIRAAGVDVIRDEISSSIKSSPLINYAKEHDNLIITPHIAGLSTDSEGKAALYAINELDKYFK